jgi:hypothetical protein
MVCDLDGGLTFELTGKKLGVEPPRILRRLQHLGEWSNKFSQEVPERAARMVLVLDRPTASLHVRGHRVRCARWHTHEKRLTFLSIILCFGASGWTRTKDHKGL